MDVANAFWGWVGEFSCGEDPLGAANSCPHCKYINMYEFPPILHSRLYFLCHSYSKWIQYIFPLDFG
ncbi:hypothetical protein POVWA2_023380 [Plasmodium ovale wallikeri]|uniref:Uncharacterized protein n=1 Tax=Plasmodium ovale wallikeri TaxID=864142 RepID=A0A1A8YTD4_PLAOA|nr:hypothetical protein POVWA1_023580 [Plasmodium ovale wallikeri]SBT35121.1 hypothetical protein POVWA2_023380 [Plasmodium ovale wallikeri]